MQFQQVEQVVVAGAFHQHQVTGLEQGSHQQVEALAGALGGDDLRRVDMNIDQAQALLKVQAQMRRAQRGAVVEQRVVVAAHHLADRLAQVGVVSPGIG